MNVAVKSPERITLDEVALHGRSSSFPMNEVTLRHFAPGELRTEYGGVESLIVRKAQGYYTRYTTSFLEDYYEHSNFTPCEYDRMLDRIWGCQLGQYYERTFFESMLSEKGGAGSTVTETIGTSHEVISFLGVSLSNDGRITTGDIRFFFDSIRAPTTEPYALSESALIRKTSVVGGFQFEEHKRFERFEVSLRPNMTFRIGSDPKTLISSISATGKLKIYSRLRKSYPLLVITGSVEYDPPQNYLQATCIIELMVW